jgi:hypothetical protein
MSDYYSTHNNLRQLVTLPRLLGYASLSAGISLASGGEGGLTHEQVKELSAFSQYYPGGLEQARLR